MLRQQCHQWIGSTAYGKLKLDPFTRQSVSAQCGPKAAILLQPRMSEALLLEIDDEEDELWKGALPSKRPHSTLKLCKMPASGSVVLMLDRCGITIPLQLHLARKGIMLYNTWSAMFLLAHALVFHLYFPAQ